VGGARECLATTLREFSQSTLERSGPYDRFLGSGPYDYRVVEHGPRTASFATSSLKRSHTLMLSFFEFRCMVAIGY